MSEVDLFGDAVVSKPRVLRAQSCGRGTINTGNEKNANFGMRQVIPKYRAARFGQAAIFKAEFCQIAYDTLCEGRTLAGVAARLDVGKMSVLRWRKEFPEFEDAIQRGLAVAEDLWAEEKWVDMHPTIYKLNMHQRFDWKDKTESNVNGQVGFTLVQNLGGAPALGCDDGGDFIEHDPGPAE